MPIPSIVPDSPTSIAIQTPSIADRIMEFLVSPLGATIGIASIILIAQNLRASARESELRDLVDRLARRDDDR